MSEVETWAGPFHQVEIPRGEFGKMSKVAEEIAEAIDANNQGQQLMLMVECADILGALVGYLTKGDISKEEKTYQDLWFLPADRKMFTQEEMLQQATLLAEDECADIEKCKRIVMFILGVADANKFDFDDLKNFAVLRSRVARYAIDKAAREG